MPVPRIIPSSLHAEVMRLRSEMNPDTGAVWTSREVSRWLLDTHRITASRMAVTRLEAAMTKKGDALIAQALRDEMRDEVGPMKARLVKASRKLAAAVAIEEDTSKIAAGVRALSAVVDSFAKLGGVAAPMALDVTSGGQRMAFYVPAKFNDTAGTSADVATE